MTHATLTCDCFVLITCTQILAFSRQLPYLFEAQQQQLWKRRSDFPPGELDGQTVLVVGMAVALFVALC